MCTSAVSTPSTRALRWKNWLRHFASLALAGVLAACIEPTAPPAPRTEASAALSAGSGVSAQSIAYSNNYRWSQGDPPTYMGANEIVFGIDRVCYLTRVSGRFTSYNESVRIYLVGNDWYLGGSSGKAGVGAWARCMYVLAYTQEYVRFSEQNADLAHGSNWMCFLVGLGGQLAFSDGGAAPSDGGVLVPPSPTQGPNWGFFTHGNSGGTADLWMGARCARPLDGQANPIDVPGWSAYGPVKRLTTSDGRACMLRGLVGPFNSSGSYVSIFETFGGWWLDGGSSGQMEPSAAYAGCYSG